MPNKLSFDTASRIASLIYAICATTEQRKTAATSYIALITEFVPDMSAARLQYIKNICVFNESLEPAVSTQYLIKQKQKLKAAAAKEELHNIREFARDLRIKEILTEKHITQDNPNYEHYYKSLYYESKKTGVFFELEPMKQLYYQSLQNKTKEND